MRYYVSLDPTTDQIPTAVDVNELPTGQLEVMLAGRPIPVDVVWLDGSASVRVDGAFCTSPNGVRTSWIRLTSVSS